MHLETRRIWWYDQMILLFNFCFLSQLALLSYRAPMLTDRKFGYGCTTFPAVMMELQNFKGVLERRKISNWLRLSAALFSTDWYSSAEVT